MTDQDPSLDLESVRNWLFYLHGDCPGFSVVSSNLNWAGRAFEVAADSWAQDVVSYITQLDRQKAKGIYLRVTTVAQAPAEGQRGRDEDSIALPALWLDMDIAGPGHKPIKATPANPNPLPLPPDTTTCRRILQHAGIPEPTMWVHSGGGLYPWYFFKSPVKLLTEHDIDEWTDASRRLHETVAAAAADLGFHYGLGIHDMSRVMRIPGTVNRKVDGAPTQAQFYRTDVGGQTFFPDELHLPALVDQAPVMVPPVREKINLSPPSSSSSALLPGEDYNERGDILGDVLLKHGWQVHSMQRGGEIYLTRPGKERRDGHSASLRYQGSNNLYVWSSDAGLDVNTPLSPFHLYAWYEHGGDYRAAARDLGGQGYGDPLEAPTPVFPARLPVSAPQPSVPPASPPTKPAASEPVVAGGDDGDGLLSIDVTDFREAVLTMVDLLGTGPLADMFVFNDQVVRVQGILEPIDPTEGEIVREIRSAQQLRMELVRRCTCYRTNDKNVVVRAQITQDLASVVFGGARTGKGLRHMRGLSRTPVIRPDGSVWDTPGFDPVTRMIYLPDEATPIPPVPQEPTVEQVATARGMIDFMLTDFPWVTPADKINYIGLMLSPLLTNVVSTPIKMGVISAHQPGSGKTLLASILTHLHSGSMMPSLKNGGDEEIRKIVTSTLKNPYAVAIWDNVRGDLDSCILDALLTTRSWTDRVLGQSKMMTTPNDKLWLITGNNVTLGSDLTRRAVWACINPDMPNPENRDGFAVANLEDWVQANRGHLLWSLYTLIQHWSVSGKPRHCKRSDLFCGWTGVVNGIIQTAGWEGEFDSVESRQQTVDATTTEWTPLFEEILERFGEGEWTVRQLLDLISPTNTTSLFKPWSMDVLPIELLSPFQTGSSALVGRSMGVRLKQINGRYIGGVKVVQNPKRTSVGYRWRLVRHVPVATTDPGSHREGPAPDPADQQSPGAVSAGSPSEVTSRVTMVWEPDPVPDLSPSAHPDLSEHHAQSWPPLDKPPQD